MGLTQRENRKKKESVKLAAIREVEEETGVDGLKIIRPLINTLHIFNRNGKYKLKKTFWFEMKTTSKKRINSSNKRGDRASGLGK